MVNIIKDGDLFTVPADMYVLPINRIFEISEKYSKDVELLFPDAFNIMQSDRTTKKIIMGYDGFYTVYDKSSGSHLCLFSVEGWGHDGVDISRLMDLIKRLHKRVQECTDVDGRTFNIPSFGLDRLDFEVGIKPLIIDMFQNEPYTINLFEPK